MKVLIAIALLAASAAPSAHAEGNTLLVCRLAGGGTVSVLEGTEKKVDLVMDSAAAAQLKGTKEARNLRAILESADSGSTAGPIDLLEIGSGYYGSEGACGLGLEFNAKNQRLGVDRDVALQPAGNAYNAVDCGAENRRIESCSLGADLKDVEALKKYIHIEVAD